MYIFFSFYLYMYGALLFVTLLTLCSLLKRRAKYSKVDVKFCTPTCPRQVDLLGAL